MVKWLGKLYKQPTVRWSWRRLSCNL